MAASRAPLTSGREHVQAKTRVGGFDFEVQVRIKVFEQLKREIASGKVLLLRCTRIRRTLRCRRVRLVCANFTTASLKVAVLVARARAAVGTTRHHRPEVVPIKFFVASSRLC